MGIEGIEELGNNQSQESEKTESQPQTVIPEAPQFSDRPEGEVSSTGEQPRRPTDQEREDQRQRELAAEREEHNRRAQTPDSATSAERH